MLNMTVGPVQAAQEVLNLGSEQVPYFRTAEFSSVMFENERLIKKFSKADVDDKTVFITGSGTASMEAAIINFLDESDNVLVVNGGSFGQRFVELCSIHEIPYTEIKMDFGKTLRRENLEKYNKKGYTAFIVNIDETSTGVLYDLKLIHEFCSDNNLFLIVDAISSFLCDEINMKEDEIDVLITGSQKALACPPGISIITISARAIERLNRIDSKCMYLDIKNALKNAERGQTPFTPAVGILLQINRRLKMIDEYGFDNEIQRISKLANDFRTKISELPFKIPSEKLSNAVTPLVPLKADAYSIFEILKDEYEIWVCPNGGQMAHKIFRVGHIGNLSVEDNDKLIYALKDMEKRGLI